MDKPAQEPTARAEDRPFLDFNYLIETFTGRIKIAEFFASLLCGALVPHTVYKHSGGFGFISFVAWTTFISVIVDIILHLVRLWDRLLFVHTYPQVLVCLCGLGGVAFLVASLVEIGVSKWAEDPGLGYASAIFGIICAALLLVESYYHYKCYRNKLREQRDERTVEMDSPAAIQDPNLY